MIDQIKALDGDFNFEVYMSLSCHNCPDVVQALSSWPSSTRRSRPPRSTAPVPEGRSDQREIMAVPHGVPGRPAFGQGRMSPGNPAKLDTGAAART